MTIYVRDAMATDVHTIAPDLPLAEFEERSIACGVSGFPVVDGGRLVGIVSRSDVIRTLAVERTYEGQLSDEYDDAANDTLDEAAQHMADTEARVGARIARLCVKDAMHTDVATAEPGQPIEQAAKNMLERRVHRLPVVEGDQLAGIVTALDLARLVAEGRLAAT
ncbi:MAG: CBS domain-containing protein [Myxococcota bacterium]|jgi:CBS domain-containing protein|nr:CBS domain-containing protein [Myxococcota bacterium]